MEKIKYHIIGVMSGTSLDGIDICYVTFEKDERWKFTIHLSETVPYTKTWEQTLKQLTTKNLSTLKAIDSEYTQFLAQTINAFIVRNSIQSIDAICSHGHTALHQPENGLTFQIGNLPSLAKHTNQRVVCDFRVQDVELGGQGAPLVPIGDRLLFSDHDFCLNLGGFANISSEINKNRIAYDICPVNIILNHYTTKLNLPYDDEGKLASSGKVNRDLLKKLNALEYYELGPPKSLGLEWVEKMFLPIVENFQMEIVEILATLVEHFAIQISKEINTQKDASVLITGGGAYNTFLINRIGKMTSNRLIIPSKELVEFKEAIIFGFLGVLKLRDEINCLSSVTGASHDHSSGKVYCP